MVKFTLDNGTPTARLKKVMGFKYGQTALNTKDFGITIWLEALDVLF